LDDVLFACVFLGVFAFLIALVLGYAFPGRFLVLMLLALGLAVAISLFTYLSAPTTPEGAGSDAGEFLGRWWEPMFLLVFLIFNFIGWPLGLLVGTRLRRGRGSAEPRA
jgi:hypothetical protein